jgi:hypothetical protein
MKLNFTKKSDLTETLSVRISLKTKKNFKEILSFYSQESDLKVTSAEVIKQLINCHHEEILKHKNTFHLSQMREKMLEKKNDNQ